MPEDFFTGPPPLGSGVVSPLFAEIIAAATGYE